MISHIAMLCVTSKEHIVDFNSRGHSLFGHVIFEHAADKTHIFMKFFHIAHHIAHLLFLLTSKYRSTRASATLISASRITFLRHGI